MPLWPDPGFVILAAAFFAILVAVSIALWGILNALEAILAHLRETTSDLTFRPGRKRSGPNP